MTEAILSPTTRRIAGQFNLSADAPCVLETRSPELGADRAPVPAPGKAQGPRQVLVVDDNSILLEMLARTLQRAGFATEKANDGEEGWTALCDRDFDLVITDNEMPKLTGIDMMRRLRAVSNEPPCLLISGSFNGSETLFRQLIRPGEILAKPFSPERLIEMAFALLLYGDGSPS